MGLPLALDVGFSLVGQSPYSSVTRRPDRRPELLPRARRAGSRLGSGLYAGGVKDAVTSCGGRGCDGCSIGAPASMWARRC